MQRMAPGASLVAMTYTAQAGAEDWMVPGIILAVAEHRQRIARLLNRLDALRRDAVERSVTVLEDGLDDGTVDAPALLALFAERLRAGDHELREVVAELEARHDALVFQARHD
jgi:hypothetical protein